MFIQSTLLPTSHSNQEVAPISFVLQAKGGHEVNVHEPDSQAIF
jgi:hypothetical protein